MTPAPRIGTRLSQRPMRVPAAMGAATLFMAAVSAHISIHSRFAQPLRMANHVAMGSSVRPATIVKPISCTPLPHIAGKSITMALVHFPPNALTPKHRHPGSVTAYVLKGTLSSQIEGGSVKTYSAGDTWFEPPGAIHSFAENTSATEDADLLATFIADTNCGPLTIFD